MPTPELEWSIELLAATERGMVLSMLGDLAGGHGAKFLMDFWKREEYADWVRLYGRTVLRKHYADSDTRFTLVIPNDEEAMTIWDYFHQPIKGSPPPPWFVSNRHFNLNHRGILLKRNWNDYSRLFPDIKLPPVGYLPLVPGIRPNTWIVDEVLTEVVPDNTQPTEWKEPKI